ncbi:MAG TPA: hypothetical protein VFG91_05940 [Woeseiaceae bacterium]|nr:hypothetical protein [Woeseiaceae bacterium]
MNELDCNFSASFLHAVQSIFCRTRVGRALEKADHRDMIRAHLYGLYQLLGTNWRFGGLHKPARILQRFQVPQCALVASDLCAASGGRRGNKSIVRRRVAGAFFSRKVFGHKKSIGEVSQSGQEKNETE